MEDPKIITITISVDEMRDLAHALGLLHSKCITNIQALDSSDLQYDSLKTFYRDKQIQLNKMIVNFNKILTGKPSEYVQHT